MEYVSMESLLAIEKDAACMDVYGAEEKKKSKFSEKFRSFFKWTSKKAVFITSVPFYWFIIFRYVNWFDTGFFLFVVMASFAMSFAGSGWGIFNSLAR